MPSPKKGRERSPARLRPRVGQVADVAPSEAPRGELRRWLARARDRDSSDVRDLHRAFLATRITLDHIAGNLLKVRNARCPSFACGISNFAGRLCLFGLGGGRIRIVGRGRW